MLSVDHVRRYLAQQGIDVREMPQDSSTALLAASALGTTVATIVKSLLFFAGEEPVLILVPGDRTVKNRALARHLGTRQARLARPQEVEEITGYPVGGVPPVAHRRELRIVIDRHLLDHTTVYAAAGSANAIFAVAPSRLIEITGGQVIDADLTD